MITTTNGLPTICEFCHSELTWDGVNLVCANPMCANQRVERVKSWVMNVAPIDGLGWVTIQKYFDNSPWFNKQIISVSNLYKIARNPLARNYSVKSGSEADLFNKMLDKLCGPITISQFLLALKIPGLGKIGAKAVENAENAKIAFESILTSKYSEPLDFEYDLCGEQNIWAKLLQDKNVAKSLYTTYREYFISSYNLVKDQIIFDGLENTKSVEIKGQVVITGTLSVKRDEFVKLLESWGWTMGSKINKDTKYLITNTPDSGTSKNKEADKFGVPKVTEEQFVNTIMKG